MNDADDLKRYRESERRGRERQIEILRGMTMEQRLRVAEVLYRDAREIKAGMLRSMHPDWSEEQVQAEVRRSFLHVGR
ncbi:MAG: hypothetical protein ACOC8E_04580 [Planctomycetota bacterium]